MDSRIPKPGIPNYLKHLSDTLARLMSSNAPFDENIFTWILYCLAVGDKHLILRTNPKDLVSVQKTAKSILFSVFGLTTVSLRIRPDSTPEDLLAGLFPIPPSSPPVPAAAPPSSFPATSPLNLTPLGKRPRQNSQPGRSSSYTRGPHLHPERLSHLLPPDAQLHGGGKLRLSVAATATGTDDERGSVRALRPLSGRGYVPPDHTSHHEHHHHHHHPPNNNWGQLPSSNAQLSHAVVITGLESASAAVQETLWDVLRTRTVVLEQEGGGTGNVWNLPDGFILVYVAPLGDGSSRPAIQSALLDRFSFSANVALHAPPPTPGLDPPRSPILRRVALLNHEYLENLQRLILHYSSLHNTLFMYISNLLSSIRYISELDATLITSRCSRDLIEFTKASFVLAGSSYGIRGDGDGAGDDDGDDGDGELVDMRKVMTPDDVRRVVRHVVGHRLSVRESVHDEILGSLLCTAVQRSKMDSGPMETRRTIKEVLNEAIMAV